ncbi:amino acid permease [Arachidicoccus ginsenosidivorans]|jgi:APA family basic amino acid/polyamine antiporter|uniref:Amino acid permease n=1 Tax=Arachidicoccus ginsenosidivorans TaxID=496057 RepID=A0A5B8VR05_9BACT|nr:amino acid permease [Arachidicoccus ginsenosidivorans]QEC73035.1 amino acid permease [Arachidicoccus ginsenosidivorans]
MENHKQDAPQNGALVRSFGLKMAIIIVMSAIIGSGVFKKVAPMAEVLHKPWLVILAWVLSGVIILFGVFSIAELGTMFPRSGGPFAWLEEVYGKLVSFLYGWSCFTVIQTAAISSVAFVFAGALASFVPLPHLPAQMEAISIMGLTPFSNFGGKLVASLLIIILTIVNIRGTKKGGHVSLVFTFLITLAILIIVCLAFGSSVGSMGTLERVSELMPPEGFSFLTFITAMFIAMRHAFWGYEGWVALGFIGEELHAPKKNLPRAMIIGIVLIILLYALLNTAYLYVMPIDEMLAAVNVNENTIAAVVVVDKLVGSIGVYIVSGMILISTFGCTNATILLSSRIYYAMAGNGLFFKSVAKCHPTRNTPANSLVFQCVWGVILVFSGSFDMLTDLLIIAAFVFYGLIVLGVVILRIRKPEIPRPYKTWGYPMVPWVFLVFCGTLLVVSLIESPVKSLIGFCLIFSGLPFYYYWTKKGKQSQLS